MLLPKDLLPAKYTDSWIYTKPRIFLCEPDKTKLCQLYTTETSGTFKFNAYSELNCTVGRTYEDFITSERKVNKFYDKIEALRLLYVEGFGYFEIQEPELVSDGIMEVKNITAYSYEYSLSQKYLNNFKINTGDNDSLEVVYANGENIVPITLHSNNPNLSLLDLVLQKVYGWKIGHVDSALETMSRTFEISRQSVYDFITQEICEKFNCFAVFDTIDNTINLYAEASISKFFADGINNMFYISPPYKTIDVVTIDGYRTQKYTYSETTGLLTINQKLEKGQLIQVTDGSQERWRSDVYVSFDNLAQEVNISYNADDIKTVLTVKGTDDLGIDEVNMGLPYITDLSYYYTVDWMGQELYDAYTEYLIDFQKVQSEYTENAEKILELKGRLYYENMRLSLQYSIASHVNSETVGEYYVRGGQGPNYYYTQVNLPADYNANITYYSLSGNDLNETKVNNLLNALQIYTRENNTEELSKLNEEFKFMETNTISHLISAIKTNLDEAVLNFLNEMWNQIGLAHVNYYLITYKGIKDGLISEGWNNSTHPKYKEYLIVDLFVKSLNDEKNERAATIKKYQDEHDALSKVNDEISMSMNIDTYFKQHYSEKVSNQLLTRLSAFLREDEYTDDNFAENSTDTTESLIKLKQELLECGRIELQKLCEPKLEFSMDMANIYALPEFEPIVGQFQLGSLINIYLRKDYFKRARLLEVNINFDDFSDFSCSFGELTNIKTPSSLHADLLASALSAGKSVASNSSYWNKGADLATQTDLKIQQGLLDAVEGLYSSDQGVIIDRNGIRLTKIIDEASGAVSPNQGWIVNNRILYSSDGFKTAKVGLGEFEVNGAMRYGIMSEFVLSGYIESSTIVGGTIQIGPRDEGDYNFEVDRFGNVTMHASSIEGYVTFDELSSSIAQTASEIRSEITQADKDILSKITQNANNITAEVKRAQEVEDDLASRITVTENNINSTVSAGSIISTINQSAESITIDANKISLAGKNINLTSDNIAINSTNFSVTKDGKITATSGEIAGWSIYNTLLRKQLTIDNIDYQMYLQSPDGVNSTNAFAVRQKLSSTTDWDTQFAVSYAGKLTAKNANITGTIKATDGTIAGYNIGPGGAYANAIYKRVSGANTEYEVGMKATNGETDLAFYVKQSTDKWVNSNNIFYVNNSGKLYCENADVTGKITASNGSIGGWSIGSLGSYSNSLYSTYCAADIPSSTNPEYAVFMRSYGGPNNIAIGVKKRTSSSTAWSDSQNPFYVRKDGYVYMNNADVEGKITASSGDISGNLSISGSLVHERGNYKVTLRGVQSTISNGVFFITDSSSESNTYPFRVNGDGSFTATKATITGDSTIAAACIPNLSASKITTGTLDTNRLDASVITTGNFSAKTLSTGNLTVASGCRLGVASEYNALIRTVGDYTYIRGYGPDISYETSFYNLVKYVVQNSSSRDIKNDIHDFDDRYDIFFDKLKPQLFRYNFELNAGCTMGYIWQEAEEARIESNLSRDDIGAITETDSVVGGKALSKQDFIALNTWQIQKLKNRVAKLEKIIEDIYAKLS